MHEVSRAGTENGAGSAFGIHGHPNAHKVKEINSRVEINIFREGKSNESTVRKRTRLREALNGGGLSATAQHLSLFSLPDANVG
ncbi:MAG: hypothetical protein COV67_14710 [Nitrospinae bacterium CG11_big_fil_rev_8_21_14_0_20_56_8]|nr:MAG: hypothetical protein COV67_14710 [Nitrospinae bacterium CG11_big_fil_rev_8_21_14_0_20_56_8]